MYDKGLVEVATNATEHNTVSIDGSICMIQIGARLHYGAAAALARHGVLAALVTDATSESRDLRGVQALLRIVVPDIYARLSGRVVPDEIDRSKLHSYIRPSIEIRLAELLGASKAKSARWNYIHGIGGHRLSNVAIRKGFFGAKTLYVHPCVSTRAVAEAKQKGLTVMIEAISHPQNKWVEFEECARFGIACDQSADLIQDNIDFFRDEAVQADRILAASPFVRDGLVELGLPRSRIDIVRYGLDEHFASNLKPDPKPGRVLFVGAVNLLKGLPYLAEAARILKRDEVYRFDVVGPIVAVLKDHPVLSGPTYHGQVPRSRVREYFRSADVFVFPTLSDGFGLVLLEAMSAGLPVVSTANCADLVEDGVNGFIVPVRDAAAIADKVQRIVRDRDLRERMSFAARTTARRFTIDNYGKALLAAVGGANC